MKKTEGIDRINRLALALIGLVVACAGAAGLGLNTGVLGSGSRDRYVSDALFRSPSDFAEWIGLVIVLAAILFYVCIRWLIAQFRLPPRVRSLKVERGRRGTTEVRGGALERAVNTNLSRLPGAVSSRASLVKNGTGPNLDIRLELADDADVPEVVQSAGEILSRTTRLAGLGQLKTSIRLVPVRAERVQ